MAISSGKYAKFISDRSGQEFPYSEMVIEWNGARVHISEFEKKQKKKLFDAARAAYENNDYEGLMDISEQLGLDVPDLPEEYYEKVEKEIVSLMPASKLIFSFQFKFSRIAELSKR